MASLQLCSPLQWPEPNSSPQGQLDNSKEQCAQSRRAVLEECSSTALEVPVWSLLQPCLPTLPSTRMLWPPRLRHPLTLGESYPRIESRSSPAAPNSP